MRKAAPYLVSGVLFLAVGLCMLLSPVSLGTVTMALVSVYIIIDGVRSLLAIRRAGIPGWLFALVSVKNAVCIAGGIALLVMIFALPDFLFTLFVFIAGGALIAIAVVNAVFFFATGRHYLAPGTAVGFALGIVLILYPFIMAKPGFSVAAAVILASGTASLTAGMMRLRLASDISGILLELGARDDIRVSDVADAMERRLMHTAGKTWLPSRKEQ